MNDLTTESEMRQLAIRSIEMDPGTIKVDALRPAYRNKQNVTVKVHVSDNEKLTQLAKVKIGWVNSRIIEKHTDEIRYK